MSNEEKLLLLAAARRLGFEYAEDGKLTCTLEQLMQLSVLIASTAIDQMKAYGNE